MPDDRSSPKLSSLKYLVETILHSDRSTIMKVGDQREIGTAYALKIIKKGDEGDEEETPKPAKGGKATDGELFQVDVERAGARYEASQKVSHPTLLKYLDFRTKRSWLLQVNRAELLMEFVNGLSLDKIEKIQVADAVLIAGQVSAGMAHLHRRGVLHGDLCPSHVMVSRSGQVKVLGYGLSLVKNRDHAMGSRLYQAPEQIKGQELNEKTDIYSFGATFYHVLTGQPANQGKREMGEGGKIPIPQALNPRISTALNNVLVSCLQSHPPKRPESFFDVQEQLTAISRSMGIEEKGLRGVASAGE